MVTSRILIGLALVAAVVTGVVFSLRAPPEIEALFPAPAFDFPDQHGQRVTRESLKGKVWVANFVFTQCRTICPLLTAKMVQLQRQLEGVDARFVSFSVDPANDTPEVLAAYAQKWRANEPRWLLLSTEAATLPALARDFKVVVAKNPQADALDPIIHTPSFLLVDVHGGVRGIYDSDEPDSFEKLANEVRKLAKQSPPVAPLATDAASLYHQLSCDTCHENPSLAPGLGGLANTRRKLEHAQSAIFDAAYVRESILQPNAKRLEGYPLRMPTYVGLLDEARTLALVKWILEKPGSGAVDTATTQRDPVCGMDVRADEDALSATVDGGTYYFCSKHCRDTFVGE